MAADVEKAPCGSTTTLVEKGPTIDFAIHLAILRASGTCRPPTKKQVCLTPLVPRENIAS